MNHALKTWPEYYEAALDGTKTFELRRHDRPFRVGDTLTLREWDPCTRDYTGREYATLVTYVLVEAELFGLMDGFVILGLEPMR